MAVANTAARQAAKLLRSSRSLSCPDLSRSTRRVGPTGSVQPARQINMMLLNPRAPKIRHLNASHSLLIEMEKHVRKVQELEHKVHELEMQLQLRELVKAHTLIEQAKQEVATRPHHEAQSEEAQKAFAARLAEARRKTEQLSAKRNQEEAHILRAWHMKKLGSAISQLSRVPETEVMMLPEPTQPNERDLANHASMINVLDSLVDTIQPVDDIERLKALQGERDNLSKLVEDIIAKERQANSTVEDCQNTLHNVGAARIKVSANLKMSKTLLNTMQNLGQQRKNHDMFVFGPNPIFNSAKDIELDFSISNQFVIEMLKELDISHIVAQKNLQSAKECKIKYNENRAQIEESLQLLQETIDMQTQAMSNDTVKTKNIKMKEMKPAVAVYIETRPKEVGREM